MLKFGHCDTTFVNIIRHIILGANIFQKYLAMFDNLSYEMKLDI